VEARRSMAILPVLCCGHDEVGIFLDEIGVKIDQTRFVAAKNETIEIVICLTRCRYGDVKFIVGE
jgi:hypothetical protein